jgi:hypothetical protein
MERSKQRVGEPLTMPKRCPGSEPSITGSDADYRLPIGKTGRTRDTDLKILNEKIFPSLMIFHTGCSQKRFLRMSKWTLIIVSAIQQPASFQDAKLTLPNLV